jgi:PHP-associated
MTWLTHPYEELTGGEWLRGNLHAHTTNSDGTRPTQLVVDDYAARGYDFLAITDHDLLASVQDLARYRTAGLLLLPGNEVTADAPHLTHINGRRPIAPHADRQQVFDDVERSGGFCFVNHPNYEKDFDHCPLPKMQTWTGYIGLEIYNAFIGRINGDPDATAKWDALLSEGRQLWGFANDDSHEPEHVGQAWNTVYAAARTTDAVVEALEAGRFYGSSGVVIDDIAVDGLTVRLTTDNAERIVAIRDPGVSMAEGDGPVLEVDVPPDARYVRFECRGTGEQRAWTQPFFVAG